MFISKIYFIYLYIFVKMYFSFENTFYLKIIINLSIFNND